MSRFLEKLGKMDRVYVGLESLKDDLKNYKESSFSEEWKNRCFCRTTAIICDSNELKLEITELLDRIQVLMAGKIDDEVFKLIFTFVEKTQQIFSKIYVRFISNEDSYKEEYFVNYYETEYEKNALLVYILQPFIFDETSASHTNQVEAKIIAETLSSKGYNIDLINTRYIGEVDAGKYDLIIGEGNIFEKISTRCGKATKKIYYLTRSSSYFSNMAELKRLRDFEKRNNYMPQFERYATDLLNLPLLAKMDAAICLGNEHTVSTYKGMFKKIYPLNVSGFSDIQLPDINKSRTGRNFLWYGGAGPIHKGLDLCIEAFRSLADLNLYIVGEVTAEFYNFYTQDLEQSHNIVYCGFLRKDSEKFLQICETCDYCILPSCSESQSTAVISAMFGGLIPICTKEVGINVTQAGGFVIDDIAIDKICALVRSLSKLDVEELEVRQQKAYEYVVENHSVDSYRKGLSSILDVIIQ